jgi:hypothetical protein
MLIAIGEASVNQISEGYSDERNPEFIFSVVSKEIQSKSWCFNTEEDYPSRPNFEHKTLLSDSILGLEFKNNWYVQRSIRVYEKKNHSYKIKHTLKVSIKRHLPIKELPEVARAYIKHVAIKHFQEDTLGSQSLSNQDTSDAQSAYHALIAAEFKNSNVNVFSHREQSNRLLCYFTSHT